MKKILALALTALLAVGLFPTPAMAQDTLNIVPVKEFRFPSEGGVMDVFTLQNTGSNDVIATVEVFDQAARHNVQTMDINLPSGGEPVAVQAYVYKPLTHHGEVNTYSYTIKTAGGFTRRLYYAQKLTITTDSNGNQIHVYDQITNSYYPRNTVSAFGPHFRDVTPQLTDLWYMFTPIDLSIQGRQTFVLVASNMYEVGEAYVDVNMDTVTVTYRMFHEEKQHFTTERLSEFITFYNSYNDVSIVEPEDMPSPSNFAFGQPISILNHLDGDTHVLMFIRNRITYYRFPAPKDEYIRFWENKPEYKTRREAMLQMMDPLMTVAPAAN
ncbi:MAG: hypothetical protein GX124_03810 [Clostridiales bacterium]|nr:hypothetical protein [Clostridiales bacterium]